MQLHPGSDQEVTTTWREEKMNDRWKIWQQTDKSPRARSTRIKQVDRIFVILLVCRVIYLNFNSFFLTSWIAQRNREMECISTSEIYYRYIVERNPTVIFSVLWWPLNIITRSRYSFVKNFVKWFPLHVALSTKLTLFSGAYSKCTNWNSFLFQDILWHEILVHAHNLSKTLEISWIIFQNMLSLWILWVERVQWISRWYLHSIGEWDCSIFLRKI
jgi:hypothetical protein